MPSTKTSLTLVAGLLSAHLLTSCASNPATGNVDVVLMSESREIAMGKEAHEELMEQGAAYPNEELQRYVDRIGQHLAANSDRPDIAYTFTVVNDDSINAFALPGGYIYMNRGLMAYLDSEEELAAVLAHEVGHVTARHSVRQQTANTTTNVASQIVGILSQNRDLYQASQMYGTSLVRGYGREMELEADGEGAEYLHNSGYDPNALLDVIGVLKDQETYQRAKAKAAGRKPQSYHGLYATHPRNDKRLQRVIQTAAELPPQTPQLIDPDEYRRVTEGMAYGKSAAPPKREDDRYYHNKLGFTFAVPEFWSVERGSRAIVTSADTGDAKITLTIQRVQKGQSLSQFLREKTGSESLFQTEPLNQEGLIGATAISPGANGTNQRRVAVLQRGSLAYLFEGAVADESQFSANDPQFMEVISSFRPMKQEERGGGKRQYISWVQVQPGESFASIARRVRIPDAENELRRMNGYYPSGEPRVGDWIKIVKDEKT